MVNASAGSSPRVRGTQKAAKNDLRQRRFIPACAGNTSIVGVAGQGPAVHPRVCGEHPNVTRPTVAVRGVHPRVCGEHERQREEDWIPAGSSPRVRGTRERARRGVPFAGFIPACAGNTSGTRCVSGSSTVHPRVCGEHTRPTRRHEENSGSSPRVRGTPVRADPDRAGRRFIPACAGNTVSTTRGTSQCTGSSPRVRGTPVHVYQRCRRHGRSRQQRDRYARPLIVRRRIWGWCPPRWAKSRSATSSSVTCRCRVRTASGSPRRSCRHCEIPRKCGCRRCGRTAGSSTDQCSSGIVGD